LLAGEPGIGKTRTAQELAIEAHRQGVRVLVGRCCESEGAPPFWPWVQIVRAHVADRDPETLKAEMGAAAADIARFVVDVRQRLPDLPPPPTLEPQQERFRFFDSVTAFLKTAANAQPLVFVLDDLHSADTVSLQLLQFIARRLGDAPLLIIGTYRDVEVGHPLAATLGELARAPGSRSLVLKGLTEREVARFIALATDHVPPETLVSAVYGKTEGNPFFVTEVVRLLVTEGHASALSDPQSAIGLPRRVREAIGHRLQALSEGCRRLLGVAAVIGREFSLNVVEAAAGCSRAPGDPGVLEVLDEAVSARLIAVVPHAVGRYSFSHALIRETLYETLSAAQRTRLHCQAGTALEEIHAAELEPYLAELAFHFYQAAPTGVVEKAAAYAQRAGEQAMQLLAYEQAVSHYERALQVLELQPPGRAQRCELLLSLGDALWRAGESARARQRFVQAAQIARRLGAAELLARAALGLGHVRAETGVVDEVLVELLGAALAALSAGDSALRARVLARLAIALYFSPSAEERRNSLSLEALAMAQRVGDRSTLAFALLARHFVLWGPASIEERLALATEVVRLAQEAGDPGVALEGRAWKILALLELGDIEAADREIESYAGQSGEQRTPRNRWYLHLVRSGRAFLAGQFAEGERLAAEAAAVQGEAGEQANAFMFFCAQMFTVRREQGRLEELETTLIGLAAQFATLPIWRCSLAVFHCEVGNPEAARREFEQLAAHEFAALPHDANRPAALALLSEACSLLGDPSRAAVLYKLLLPYAERNIVVATSAICYGPAARYLGLLAATLGRWEDAARHFAGALAMSETMGARPWAAHTQHDYARMLLARGAPGDQQKAGELLEHALATARELGMQSLAEKIHGLRGDVGLAFAPPHPASCEVDRSGPPPVAVFRRDGDYWTVAYQGSVFHLKDSIGARYLSCLLQQPHKECHVFELVELAATPGVGIAAPRPRASLGERGLHAVGAGDAVPLLDAQARHAYRRRVADLRSELDEARSFHDIGRIEKVQEELAFVSQELAGGFGLNRRYRRAWSSADQVRVNVTRALKRVIKKISTQHRGLGLHLENTISTGLFCSYKPDPRVPISWRS
jgi:tetratricopeptide (TPR) repeat protein